MASVTIHGKDCFPLVGSKLQVGGSNPPADGLRGALGATHLPRYKGCLCFSYLCLQEGCQCGVEAGSPQGQIFYEKLYRRNSVHVCNAYFSL